MSCTKTVILDSPSDLEWAKEVHFVPEETKFAILFGNEDAPIRIECWYVLNPEFDSEPDAIVFDGRKVVSK